MKYPLRPVQYYRIFNCSFNPTEIAYPNKLNIGRIIFDGISFCMLLTDDFNYSDPVMKLIMEDVQLAHTQPDIFYSEQRGKEALINAFGQELFDNSFKTYAPLINFQLKQMNQQMPTGVDFKLFCKLIQLIIKLDELKTIIIEIYVEDKEKQSYDKLIQYISKKISQEISQVEIQCFQEFDQGAIFNIQLHFNTLVKYMENEQYSQCLIKVLQDSKIYKNQNQLLNPLNEVLNKFQSGKETELPEIHAAIRRASVFGEEKDLLKLLPLAQDINQQDDNPKVMRTALHWAIIERKKKNEEILIFFGARDDIKDANNKTPNDYQII